MRADGFPPIAGPGAQVLVLGSLPGAESLRRQEYYAQPRNAFWKIMGALVDAGPERAYAERTARLIEAGIAVWDVCACAWRPGSLDSSIDAGSVVVNDLGDFLARHPQIGRIYFNGATAATVYGRRVLPLLPTPLGGLVTRVLPSTSPAHAAMPFEAKLAAWQALSRSQPKRS
jgi:double-stranded uracil-DNA glycosylase